MSSAFGKGDTIKIGCYGQHKYDNFPSFLKFAIDFEFDFNTDMKKAEQSIREIVKANSIEPYKY